MKTEIEYLDLFGIGEFDMISSDVHGKLDSEGFIVDFSLVCVLFFKIKLIQ